MRLIGSAVNAPFVGFTIWPEAALVEAVEGLVEAGDHDGAYSLLQRE